MNFNRMLPAATAAAVLLTAAAPAVAHTGADALHGFGAGLAHPFGGLDHLLAMLAVGLWAAQDAAAGRRVLLLPAVFVAALVLGFGLAVAGIVLPGIEGGIALSVLLLGLAVAFAVRLPAGLAAVLVAAFAVCHGHAHGSEIGADAGLLAWGAGMALATALLHGGGALAAVAALQLRLPVLTRIAGAAVAGGGVAILAG